MKRKTMRSILALLLLLIPVLAAGRAEQAEPVTQTVQLPGSPWAVSIPKEMRYDGPRNGDGSCVFAYWLPDGTGNGARMEIDFFFYASEGMNLPEAARMGYELLVHQEHFTGALRGLSGTEPVGTPLVFRRVVETAAPIIENLAGRPACGKQQAGRQENEDPLHVRG